jgi:hypothetical protein
LPGDDVLPMRIDNNNTVSSLGFGTAAISGINPNTV